MKHLIFFLFVLIIATQSHAQTIHINQLNKDFTSYLPITEQAYIDSILNSQSFTISLVSLIPICDSPGDCYEASVMYEEPGMEAAPGYPFGQTFLRNVNKSRFDTIVPLNTSHYVYVLEEVLMGEPPVDGDQIMNMCYNPRHAVIIQNSEEKILGILEVCFECGKSKVGFYRSDYVEGISGTISDVFSRYGLMK